MSIAAFTFGSFGDIVALVQLSAQLVQFLAGASFNSGPYCDLILQVKHLNVLLTKLDTLVAASRHLSTSGITDAETEKEVLLESRRVLESIKQRAFLYSTRLQSNGVSWAKMGAMLFKEHELLKFKVELESTNTMVIRLITSITVDLQLSQHRSTQETESCVSMLSSNQKALLQIVQGLDRRLPQVVSQFTGASEYPEIDTLHERFATVWSNRDFVIQILVRQTYRMPRYLFANGTQVIEVLGNFFTYPKYLPVVDRDRVLSHFLVYRNERDGDEGPVVTEIGERTERPVGGDEGESEKGVIENHTEAAPLPTLDKYIPDTGLLCASFGTGYIVIDFQTKDETVSMTYTAYTLHSKFCENTTLESESIGRKALFAGIPPAYIWDSYRLNAWSIGGYWLPFTFASPFIDARRRRLAIST